MLETLKAFLRKLLSRDDDSTAGGSSNRREFARFTVPYRVTVMSGMKSFKSTCLDISLGGMRLKDRLPPYMVGNHCKVFISATNPNDSIEFNCKIIVDSAYPKRLKFSDGDLDSMEKLTRWLKAHG